MNFMKDRKIKIILLCIFILVFVISIIAIVSVLYTDSSKDVYGNRLSGIEDVKVSNQEILKIKDDFKLSKLVKTTDYSLKGRLMNFVIEVEDTTKVADVKKIAQNILTSLDEKVQGYYDIQLFIVSNDEKNEDYPIMAYKHKTSKNFVWTNN